jgi:protein-tyrosine-phosphatase
VTGDPFRIAVVCTANRFRSPIVASVLRRELEGRPVEITSRGLLNLGALPPLVEAVRIGGELGLPLATHRAQSLVAGELSDTDLVIGFERAHLVAATEQGRASPSAVFTLPELVDRLDRLVSGSDGKRAISLRNLITAAARVRGSAIPETVAEIPDPIGRSEAFFEATANRIVELATTFAQLAGNRL